MNKICPACGKEFETKFKHKIYCSSECSYKFRYAASCANRTVKIYKKICSVCGKEFETKFTSRTICSDECKRLHQKEYKRSLYNVVPTAESGKKKSVKRGCFACGKIFERAFPNEKFCSDECRLKYFKVSERVG